MPKILDYEAQKNIIANATRRVISEGGLRKATVRNIAAEAGLSVGSLRHCFPNQEDLLQYAMNIIVEQVTERIDEQTAALQPEDITVDTALNIFSQLAALEEEQNAEMEVWLAFCVEAFYKPDLKLLNDKMYDSIHNVIYQVLQAMKNCGLVRRELNLEYEVEAMHLLIDGLALHRAIRPEKNSVLQMKDILGKKLKGLV